jgi:hypothetical protein
MPINPDNSEEIPITEEQHIQDFETKSHQILDEFGKSCERHGLHNAIAIIANGEKAPKLFFRGHIYDITVLLTKIANELKTELLSELK